MKRLLIIILALNFALTGNAQKDFYDSYHFTEADTLRGMMRPERSCFDVHYYDLNILVDIEKQFIIGYNDIHFEATSDFTQLQIDLFQNMDIHKILYQGESMNYKRIHNAVFIQMPLQKKGDKSILRVYYKGAPTIAINPPWEGGFIWTTDKNGKPWIGVSCEGDGASLWWPNKDHLSDEPDSMSIRVTTNNEFTCIANGNLRSKEKVDEQTDRYHWFVSYPINNYNVTINIGDYAHFSETYFAADSSELALDYYVLSYNLAKAKKHFKQVHGVLACFENVYGKYPFWEDGYALVETPYLGMEHQGAIAYGNNYLRGYMGEMIPNDMDWDYIIVHETGHEYWGNSISCNDLCEMWIHESFTTYMEAMYVECRYGYEDYVRYMNHFRNFLYISNQEPILGPKNVNWEDWKSSDHYFKGSWILHSLRHAINNENTFYSLMQSFYEKHALSTIHTEDFVRYVNEYTGRDYTAFFEQYLAYPALPVFECQLTKDGNDLKLKYRWKADVAEFDMPLLVGDPDDYLQIFPTTDWQELVLENFEVGDFEVAEELFLIEKEIKL